jgi:hypothetical protein
MLVMVPPFDGTAHVKNGRAESAVLLSQVCVPQQSPPDRGKRSGLLPDPVTGPFPDRSTFRTGRCTELGKDLLGPLTRGQAGEGDPDGIAPILQRGRLVRCHRLNGRSK